MLNKAFIDMIFKGYIYSFIYRYRAV